MTWKISDGVKVPGFTLSKDNGNRLLRYVDPEGGLPDDFVTIINVPTGWNVS